MIQLRSLSYTYPGARAPSLSDLSLQVEGGEFVVLAGMSGSGKSTLIRLLCGLIPHFHGGEIAGSAWVAGLDLRSNGPADLAGSVGVLLQDPETQVVMGTVRSELAFPLENRGYSPAEVARSVEEIALALGIDRLLDRTPNTLSGGELQRLALGAALATRPELVVLDEPCSQLDPVAGDELIALLRRLNEEWGTTVVVSEHRLERCLIAATRVVALAEGRCVYDGSPKEFLRWSGREARHFETPSAELARLLGIGEAPVTVAEARRLLAQNGLLGAEPPVQRDAKLPGDKPNVPALKFDRVWHELKDGPTLLRDVNLEVASGELVAIMGRNGAGKTTLLRHAAGLVVPTRGKAESAGKVALLTQNPGDYLVAATVKEEADSAALEAVGLDLDLGDRDTKDLSGGERQRLALATVIEGEQLPAVICLDEPTRGMDRAAKSHLARLLGRFASRGVAVLVVTHDPEFVADFAERVVVLAEGHPIVDGHVHEVLSGGWYFVTEIARLLGLPGVLTPRQGAKALAGGRTEAPVGRTESSVTEIEADRSSRLVEGRLGGVAI